MNCKHVKDIQKVLKKHSPTLSKVWERCFKSYILGRRFPNPETGERVKFDSLPPREQKKVRKQFRRIKKEEIC